MADLSSGGLVPKQVPIKAFFISIIVTIVLVAIVGGFAAYNCLYLPMQKYAVAFDQIVTNLGTLSTDLKAVQSDMKEIKTNVGTVQTGIESSVKTLIGLSDRMSLQWNNINTKMTQNLTDLGFAKKPTPSLGPVSSPTPGVLK